METIKIKMDYEKDGAYTVPKNFRVNDGDKTYSSAAMFLLSHLAMEYQINKMLNEFNLSELRKAELNQILDLIEQIKRINYKTETVNVKF